MQIDPIDWHSLAVDRESELPVGTQLAWKLQALIAAGRLAPDDRLPGVRQLAESVGVNVNTVRSVYARLEEQGLISSQHGRGTFVAAPGESAGIGRLAAQAAAEARSAGVDPRAVATALYAEPEAAEPPPAAATPSVPDREYREELRRQITELERQIAYYTRHTVGEHSEAAATPRPTGRVLSAGELAGVRDELLDRVTRLRRDEEERRELVAEVREELEREAEEERHAEIESASKRDRPTPDRPPSVVYGPSAWTLRWKA